MTKDSSLLFRNILQDATIMAFGCSHTWGVGVETDETWPYLLGAMNFGIGSASSDQVVRLAKEYIPKHCPSIVYCLWPCWSRFEYEKMATIIKVCQRIKIESILCIPMMMRGVGKILPLESKNSMAYAENQVVGLLI